jgi:acyl-CoA oxidase
VLCHSGNFRIEDFRTDPMRIFAAHEVAAFADVSMATKMTVQVGGGDGGGRDVSAFVWGGGVAGALADALGSSLAHTQRSALYGRRADSVHY